MAVWRETRVQFTERRLRELARLPIAFEGQHPQISLLARARPCGIKQDEAAVRPARGELGPIVADDDGFFAADAACVLLKQFEGTVATSRVEDETVAVW